MGPPHKSSPISHRQKIYELTSKNCVPRGWKAMIHDLNNQVQLFGHDNQFSTAVTDKATKVPQRTEDRITINEVVLNLPGLIQLINYVSCCWHWRFGSLTSEELTSLLHDILKFPGVIDIINADLCENRIPGRFFVGGTPRKCMNYAVHQ